MSSSKLLIRSRYAATKRPRNGLKRRVFSRNKHVTTQARYSTRPQRAIVMDAIQLFRRPRISARQFDTPPGRVDLHCNTSWVHCFAIKTVCFCAANRNAGRVVAFVTKPRVWWSYPHLNKCYVQDVGRTFYVSARSSRKHGLIKS